MSIWLASSEIIFVCESTQSGHDGVDYIYDEVSKQYEFIKQNHNELASWIEEQLNSKKKILILKILKQLLMRRV